MGERVNNGDVNILPPPDPDTGRLPRIPDRDDEEQDWSAIERQGVEWRVTRERDTVRPQKP